MVREIERNGESAINGRNCKNGESVVADRVLHQPICYFVVIVIATLSGWRVILTLSNFPPHIDFIKKLCYNIYR